MEIELKENTELSHYRIVSKIGAGGMGEVYLAEDTKLDRKVAIKFLNNEFNRDSDTLNRFIQEAKAASALNHPNILTVYEIGETDDTNYIVTEFIEGKTLREHLLLKETLTLDAILIIGVQVAEALSAAHQAGIIHRDIKPENIMIRKDGYAKVLDFGLAKLAARPALTGGSAASEDATMAQINTTPGMVMGTSSYMSPEQAKGKEVDGRSDVFSLGIVLYEMLSGKRAFGGENSLVVIGEILNKEPTSLSQIRPELPREIERIVNKTLRKDREERYQTARGLLTDLKDVRGDLEFQDKMERSSGPNREVTKTQMLPLPANVTQASQTLNAEYVVTEIQRHKKSAILIAALTVAAIAASIFFLNLRGASALTEKDTILLTDFVNTTGDADFDGTLKQALAVQLGQSPFLNIFSEDRARDALKFMGRSPDERLTRDVGREICQRQGLKVMLVGSIASLGNHYVITLEAINAQTSDGMALEQAEAENKEQVLHALSEAAMRLREKLGESLQSIQKFDAPIEQATTSSFEAFKAFSLGIEQQLKGKFLEAIPFFKRATEIDPNFALAYARMASIYYNSRQYDLAAEASQKAYELRDRVSERERLYISAGYYDNVTGELDKYLETLELWKSTYPRDAPPHNNLALKYNELTQFDKAVEEANESIRLNPNSASGYSLLAAAFGGLNRFDEAKEIIRQALAQKLETTAMHGTLYRIAFAQGDATTMREQIEWLKGKPDEYLAQNWQAESVAFSGQLRAAKEFSNHAFELAAARDLKEVTAQIAVAAATREALFGDCRLVKEQTAKALGISHRQQTMITAGTALATCGEISQAQTIIDELVKRFPQDTLLNKILLPLVQARIELRRGNPALAIQLLETTRPYEGYVLFQIPYLRGQSYLNQKRGTDAAAEFQKILDHRGWQIASPLYPLAHLGLARSAASSGDTTKARKAYQDFFALWRDADPDIPILQEARREYEKLK